MGGGGALARGGGFSAAGRCRNEEEVRNLTKVPDRVSVSTKVFQRGTRRAGGGGSWQVCSSAPKHTHSYNTRRTVQASLFFRHNHFIPIFRRFYASRTSFQDVCESKVKLSYVMSQLTDKNSVCYLSFQRFGVDGRTFRDCVKQKRQVLFVGCF